MADFKQAERGVSDGPVSVRREDDGTNMLSVTAVQGGNETFLRVSEYNAARIVGMLAVFLGIPLGSKASKAIKL